MRKVLLVFGIFFSSFGMEKGGLKERKPKPKYEGLSHLKNESVEQERFIVSNMHDPDICIPYTCLGSCLFGCSIVVAWSVYNQLMALE